MSESGIGESDSVGSVLVEVECGSDFVEVGVGEGEWGNICVVGSVGI